MERKKVYVAFSHQQAIDNSEIISTIKKVIEDCEAVPVIFGLEYRFQFSEEITMMRLACEKIDECDLLIAETSVKGIGVGVETGYAKAKGKTVVYLRRANTEHSTTVSGISDYRIIYSNPIDLKIQLEKLLYALKK